MQTIISILSILQVLYLTTRVESLQGNNIRRVRDGDLSFVASLHHRDGEIFCTGVLITKSHVITSTSCREDANPAGTDVEFQSGEANAVRSWHSYYEWAVGRGLNVCDTEGISVIKLNEEVRRVNPARLSPLTKQQVIGKSAKITGWKTFDIDTDELQWSTVKFLSDEDCNDRIRFTSSNWTFGPRVICNFAKTTAMLEDGDVGAPIVDEYNNKIIGLGFRRASNPPPGVSNIISNALMHFKTNLHFSIDYYRQFIVDITGYH